MRTILRLLSQRVATPPRYTRSLTSSTYYHLCSSSSASASSSMPRGRSPTRVPGPVETSIETKLTETFEPIVMRIQNDSSKHSHHAPMRAMGGGSGETHFSVTLVSSEFDGLSSIKRHRLVNALLKDEFDNQGLHALSLRLKTPDEWDKEVEKAEAELRE